MAPATAIRWQSHALTLLLVMCTWLPSFSTDVHAQSTVTTTTTTVTTTTVSTTTTSTTSTTLPDVLTREIEDLTALGRYARQLGKCQSKQTSRTAVGTVLQDKCDTVGTPNRCARKVRRFWCRDSIKTSRCEAEASVARSPGLIESGIADDLKTTFIPGLRNTTKCAVQLPSVVSPPCPDRLPPRVKHLPQACPAGDASCDLECVNDATAAVVTALSAVADCRISAISAVAAGKTVDERSCVSNAWSTCKQASQCAAPCFSVSSMCDEGALFAKDALERIGTVCTKDDLFTCDDGNVCTVDTCTGSACESVNGPDGTTCGDDSPCGAKVCKAGACVPDDKQEGTPCTATEQNPCTDAKCHLGACTPQPNWEKFGQPCADSMCEVCGLAGEGQTLECMPRSCDASAGCVCHPNLGCVRGTEKCQ